ncbi:MAG TPA: hypothetical protein VFM02_02965 [Candidatus Paceibacterota bacterium]|nr:hypothetical protein [Candidatus Paceibacterota bacterium]
MAILDFDAIDRRKSLANKLHNTAMTITAAFYKGRNIPPNLFQKFFDLERKVEGRISPRLRFMCADVVKIHNNKQK